MTPDPVAHAFSTTIQRSPERLAFSVAFSLLEFAIKECYPVLGSQNAEPNWPAFAKQQPSLVDVAEEPTVRQAITNLLDKPPKVQTPVNGRPVYRPRGLPPDRAEALTVSLRRVRNDLFHGGKPGYTEEDRKLVNAGLVVIRGYLTLYDDVRVAFLSGT